MPTIHRLLRLQGAALAALLLLSGHAMAAPACKVVSTSTSVAIVLCARTAVNADWREAGALACKDKQACNAWIWDDESKAPKTAPAKDTDIPKSQTGAARAVWVSPGDQLILVNKAK